VSSTGDVEQPIQWSSEFNDIELGLVYYNYRHYNPVDGRWIGRDRIRNFKLYDYSSNNSIAYCDYLGDFDFASEEVKYVYDSGVNEQWGRKASAVTDIHFPPIQVKKVPYEKYGNKFRFKFPDQKYVPTITCYKGAGCDERKLDEYIRGSVYPYTTIRKHELHHVDIACQYWNVFVLETKEIEKIEYCDEKAAKVAWSYIVKRHIILNSENNIENREFDLSEYALNGDPKMRSHFQSVIREHSNIIMKNANEIISENLYEKTYNPTIDK
jgi:RHS repeat-associated protein